MSDQEQVAAVVARLYGEHFPAANEVVVKNILEAFYSYQKLYNDETLGEFLACYEADILNKKTKTTDQK